MMPDLKIPNVKTMTITKSIERSGKGVLSYKKDIIKITITTPSGTFDIQLSGIPGEELQDTRINN